MEILLLPPLSPFFLPSLPPPPEVCVERGLSKTFRLSAKGTDAPSLNPKVVRDLPNIEIRKFEVSFFKPFLFGSLLVCWRE